MTVILYSGDHCLLPVTCQGTAAWMRVDDDTAAWAVRHSWHTKSPNSPYATARIGGRNYYLHRMLTKPPVGLFVDHINGNPLDNRRSNLRVVTSAQNAANQGPRRKGSSQYKGVSRRRGGWVAQITAQRRALCIGLFAQEIYAALAYGLVAAVLHGPCARLPNLYDSLYEVL